MYHKAPTKKARKWDAQMEEEPSNKTQRMLTCKEVSIFNEIWAQKVVYWCMPTMLLVLVREAEAGGVCELEAAWFTQ
jgi:hypothetical protein